MRQAAQGGHWARVQYCRLILSARPVWLPAIWIHDTIIYQYLTIAVTHSTTLETWMAHVGKDKALAGSA